MKKLRVFLVFLLSLIVFSQENDALLYMEKINAGNDKILSETWDYLSAVAKQKSARKIEKRRGEVVESVKESIRNVQTLGAFNGNSDYKKASLKYLNFNLDLMTGKARKLVDLEEISSKSYDAMEAYILYQRDLKKLSSEENEILKVAQNNFASSNNINLLDVKNVLVEKIKKGGKVLNYKENMFLVFARCFMYEQAMMASMFNNTEDLDFANAGITLLDLTEASKQVLDTITDINTNKSLRQQTQRALDFFKQEAETFLPAFSNYTIVKNDFNDFNKEFEKTPKKKRTKEMVNEFNKKVNKLNAETNKFNALLKRYNQKRGQIFELWNTIADNFVERYMPK